MDLHTYAALGSAPTIGASGTVSLPQLKKRNLSDRLDPYFEIEKLILSKVKFQSLESYLSNLRRLLPVDWTEIEQGWPWLIEYPSLIYEPTPMNFSVLAPKHAPLSQFLSFLDCWSSQPKAISILPTLGSVFRKFRLLAEYGFAVQGKNIPLSRLLDWFDLNELQMCTKKLYGRRAYSPRKRELIEVLLEDYRTRDWVYERIVKKHRKLDWFFCVHRTPYELCPAQLSAAKDYLRYYSELWQLYKNLPFLKNTPRWHETEIDPSGGTS